LIAFFPCLFLGNSYFDGDLLNSNHILRKFLQDNLLHGHFPLWNPCLFGGQPFLASPDFMNCYPLLYPTLLFPVEYGFGVFYLSCFLIAALGMHFWLKTLGLSESSRRLGALLFALSGYFWLEIVHPPELAAFAWVPWWAGTLEKTSQRLKPAWAFAAGLVFSLLFMAGIFQLTMGVLYGGGLYLAFRLWTRRDWRGEKDKDRRLWLAPLFFLWGALPLLALWIPAREFLYLSERLHAHLDYETFQADYSLNPGRMFQFLFPINPFTPSGQALALDEGLANGGYLGPWAFLLMALAFRKARGALTLFLAAAGTGALLLSFGKFFPLHRIACQLLPGIGLSRAPFRYVFLYEAAGVVLMAMGYENLKERMALGKPLERRKLLWGLGLYSFVTAGFALWRGGDARLQLLGLLPGALSLYLWMEKKISPRKAQWVFLGSLVLCLLASDWTACTSRWGPASNFDYAARCEALAKLKASVTEPGRVLLGDDIPYLVQSGGRELRLSLPTDVAMVAGLRNALGYNPLNLDRASDLYTLPPRTFVRLMAVESFISGDKRWNIPGFSREDWNGVEFCQNQEPVNFVYAPQRVESVIDDQQRLALMRRIDFNPNKTAYFSEPMPGRPGCTGPFSKAHFRYDLKKVEPDGESFQVSIDRPGWIVFSEVMYPGWKAWVDGGQAPLFTANHLFRSVWIDAGSHEVVFRYEPVWGKPLLAGLGLWFLSVLALVLGPWREIFLKEFQKI
jgi:hypothetical protein